MLKAALFLRLEIGTMLSEASRTASDDPGGTKIKVVTSSPMQAARMFGEAHNDL
jgi:hypothetical protein